MGGEIFQRALTLIVDALKKHREKDPLYSMYNRSLLEKGFSKKFIIKLENFRRKCLHLKLEDGEPAEEKLKNKVSDNLGWLITNCCYLISDTNTSEQEEVLKVYQSFLRKMGKELASFLSGTEDADKIMHVCNSTLETKISSDRHASLAESQKKVVTEKFTSILKKELLGE